MTSDQLSLNLGSFSPPRAGDVFYFAVLPEKQAAEQALELAHGDQQEHGLSGKIYDRDRLHVSLAKVREGRGLSEAVDEFAAKLGSRAKAAGFHLCFDRIVSVGHVRQYPRILTCGSSVPGFDALIREITGLRDISGEVIPHMTLFYSDRKAPHVDLARPIAWTVRGFALVHTRKGRGEFRIVDRWPLSL
ncbi:2'-5' RNA ligase family protein [Sinorhizobium mexicanum]|uniref:Uncharacterized protein n=1 Tax=Sinorhizobium mexicanum TaxID=375549 RepID=A0A859QC53_9HYPH|nr:2'-5' RNA ligase family protein [Sinorhizobium mexicanum]MBP1887120.1 2'-5' RNA ligase [Sinorhizobium mexicanum]QLL60282.1 hypothetical protein FKV68_01910 [Sinorhizobium mexicanum]